MLFDPSSGSLVATNNPADPLTKSVDGTVVDAKFTDATDPLIRRVALSDGQEIFACSPLPCAFELGHGNDLVYVTVSNVNDSFGLGLRLVVMIPSDDFLGEIRSSASSSLGAAAGAVVGLLLLSIVAVVMIVRPLQRLELKIYASVTLEEHNKALRLCHPSIDHQHATHFHDKSETPPCRDYSALVQTKGTAGVRRTPRSHQHLSGRCTAAHRRRQSASG